MSNIEISPDCTHYGRLSTKPFAKTTTPVRPQCHPQSFFARLPYDVRAIVYSYLQVEDSPPFKPYLRCPEFVLSCRQAKQELEEIVFKRLTKLLVKFKADFEKLTDISIHVKSEQDRPNDVTVTLPYSALDGGPVNGDMHRASWKRIVLVALHPLFTKHFNTVRIHFDGSETDQIVPDCRTLRQRGLVEVMMHNLLRDISYMIERVNAAQYESHATPRATVIHAIFSGSIAYTVPYPSDEVKAQRICLSWDLRDAAHRTQNVILNGKLHHAPCAFGPCPRPINQPRTTLRQTLEHATSELRRRYRSWKDAAEPPARAGAIHEPGTPNPNDDFAYRDACFYQLRNGHRLVGEMGMISPARWIYIGEPKSFNLTINGVETIKQWVSSDGLGRQIGHGLVGISTAKFVKDEEEVSRVLYDIT